MLPAETERGVRQGEEPLDKKTVAARDVLLEQLVAVVEDQHGLHIGRGPDEDLLRYLADGALWLCEKQERARDKNVRPAIAHRKPLDLWIT